MKNKSLFIQIVSLIIIAILCLVATVSIALLAGSLNTDLFDFKNLNFSNMIPVLIIGGFICCCIVGICFLFVARSAFFKAKDYFEKNNKNEKGDEKK